MYTLVQDYKTIKKFYDDDYLSLKDSSKHFNIDIKYFNEWIETVLPAVVWNDIVFVKIGDVIELVKRGNL